MYIMYASVCIYVWVVYVGLYVYMCVYVCLWRIYTTDWPAVFLFKVRILYADFDTLEFVEFHDDNVI